MDDIVRYSDLDMNLNINPNTGDFSLKTNLASIKQHIRLLFTDNGLLFKPESRSGIDIQLFDQWNSQSKYIIERQILEHLAVYEPRINIINLDIEFDYSKQSLEIKLNYKVQEEIQDLNFGFFISSIR